MNNMQAMLVRSVACLAMILGLFPAAAQTVGVVEFRNTRLDHYFLTADPAEIAALDAGALGTEWGRTGTTLGAVDPGSCSLCAPIHRFYRPGGSHFFTSNTEEMWALRVPGSGWIYEGIAFAQNTVSVPGGNRGCPLRTAPMYRVYTDLSGPRHRYVSTQLLPKMLGQGWVQEEEVFCFLFSSAAVSRPLKTVSINAPLADRVQPLDQCRAGTADGLPCLAVSNLAADEITVVGVGSPTTRMKMNTRGRAPGALSSAGPYYPLGAARFHPFAGHAVDTELWLRYVVELYSATLDDDGSHAYGHPTLEWLDTRSGLPLHFSVLTFGRNTGDYFGRDALTGAVIVGTTYRQDSPFLLNYDTPTLAVPFQAPTGVHRAFHFSMTRQEFRRVLDRARELDPALSAEPGDYVITALRYKNEIVGNGSIDASIWPLTLDLLESRR